jgi:hypothetical protein
MTTNDTIVGAGSFGDSGSLIVDATGSGTNAAKITEIGGTAGGKVYREIDIDGDGSFEVSAVIEDSNASAFNSQGNSLRVSDNHNARLRIENTSGGEAQYWAIGYEVDE